MTVQDKDNTNILEDLEMDPLEGAYNDGVPGEETLPEKPDTKNESSEDKETDKKEGKEEQPSKKDEKKDEDPDKQDKTKGEEGEEEKDPNDDPEGQPEDEDSLVRDLQERLGIEVPEGEELTDDEDGVTNLVKIAAQQMAEQHVNEYFGAFPEMKEFYEYLQYGGEPDKFLETRFPKNDYSQVKVEEDNERQQEELIKDHYKRLGYSDDFIKGEIEDAKNGGTLENKAKRSLKALQDAQKKDKESLTERQKQEHQQQMEQVQEFWNEVTQTIDKSKEFKGISINEKDKTDFVNFLTKEVEPGKTARDAAVEKMSLEENLAIDYLLFKGFKLDDLIKRKAKTANAKSLRDRLKGGQKDSPKNSAESRRRAEAPDIENLDLQL